MVVFCAGFERNEDMVVFCAGLIAYLPVTCVYMQQRNEEERKEESLTTIHSNVIS